MCMAMLYGKIVFLEKKDHEILFFVIMNLYISCNMSQVTRFIMGNMKEKAIELLQKILLKNKCSARKVKEE